MFTYFGHCGIDRPDISDFGKSSFKLIHCLEYLDLLLDKLQTLQSRILAWILGLKVTPFWGTPFCPISLQMSTTQHPSVMTYAMSICEQTESSITEDHVVTGLVAQESGSVVWEVLYFCLFTWDTSLLCWEVSWQSCWCRGLVRHLINILEFQVPWLSLQRPAGGSLDSDHRTPPRWWPTSIVKEECKILLRKEIDRVLSWTELQFCHRSIFQT